MKTFYKIVKENHGKLHSLATTNRRIEYKLNQWVKPKDNSKLFIFKLKEIALEYQKQCTRNTILYECEVINPIVCPLILDSLYVENHYAAFLNFWDKAQWAEMQEDRDKGIQVLRTSLRTINSLMYYAPIGTYVADAVKLTRKLK
ncbi:MAG: hypothetical protein DWQ19_08960 [Crenarchaeota archaeon]|nr:MAG: hypothetical protein DWQ19_08960 [Thermoproteota archaeon]